MNRAKLAAFLLISFIATGSVIYQIRNRRPVQGVVVGSAPEPKSLATAAPGTVTAPAPIIGSGRTRDAGKPEQDREVVLNIPASGWGRNPFLTEEEITKLNQPDVPVVVETPQPMPHVESPSLPIYAVTGIISGDQGRWAIVAGRLMRPGDRVGTETLTEVKDRGIVLEHEGRMRELPLKKLEDTAAAAPPSAPPNKETKQ